MARKKKKKATGIGEQAAVEEAPAPAPVKYEGPPIADKPVYSKERKDPSKPLRWNRGKIVED